MNKKTYVTTAIPYTNAKPHVGHAMDYILCDTYARWARNRGDEVRVCAGADEHGSKNAAKAAEAGIPPQEFVDSLQPAFQELIKKLNTPYTDYVRTTSPDHIRLTQEIWKKLTPYIYKSTYTGWYCSGCEAFLTESEAREIDYKCPDHQKPLEKVSEDNYYLKVSAFGDRIKQAIQSGEMRILPDFRAREIVSLIGTEAADVSISRPVEKLSWGVPVPDDPTQTMYVWIDALSNYLTALGYPDNNQFSDGASPRLENLSQEERNGAPKSPIWGSGRGECVPSLSEWWPAALQVVGKDILRFHAIIWPAMLLALDLPLPKTLLSHGHITSGGTKMSKSLGNVIDPIEVIGKHGTDPFRYYFLRHVPTFDDGDFSWEKFESAYADELANDLGNLVQRLATMCNKYAISGREHTPTADPEYDTLMSNLEFSAALDYIWKKIQSVNRQIDENKPWELAKTDQAKLTEVLTTLIDEILTISSLLSPFLPDTSDRITQIFSSATITAPENPLFPKN